MMENERRQALEVDIDLRLRPLWDTLWGDGAPDLAKALTENEDAAREFGALVRYAYGRGYTDAQEEEASGRRGELQRNTGHRIP